MEGRSLGLRTQVSCDKFDGKDIVWLPELYTIDEIISKFPLPVLVKVVDGYMINELECVETNTILSIHGYRRMEKFTAIDQRERNLSIPVSCKCKAVVMPNFSIPLCRSIADVCRQPKVPKYITNALEFKSNNRTFPASTTFSVMSVDNTVSNGLSVLCLTETTGEITLSASTTGDFQATVHPDDRNKSCLMKDLTSRDLPLSVEFPQHGTDETIYSLRMGTVRLKDLITADVVYATLYEDGLRKLMTFSRELNIKLKMGHVMVEADEGTYSTIAEPKEDTIDEELLDNILHLDPYNGDYTIIEYDTALQKFRDCKNDRPVGIEDPALPANNETGAAVSAMPPELPSCPRKTPKKPPRIPPRAKDRNDKPSNSLPDKHEAISKLNTTIMNKYVPEPKATKAPPQLPPRRPSKEHTTVTPAQPQCDTHPPLNQAVSLGNPQNKTITDRPPLPPPRNETLSIQSGVDKLHFNKKLQRSPMPVDTSLNVKSKEVGDVSLAYEEIPVAFKSSKFPVDETLSANTSAERRESMENYEKITFHETALKRDSSLMAQKSQNARSARHAYEEVELSADALPLDTASMPSKLKRAKEPGKAYQELSLHTETLPVDNAIKLQKQEQVNDPNPYEFPSKVLSPSFDHPIVNERPTVPPKSYPELKCKSSKTIRDGAQKPDLIKPPSSKTELSNEFTDFIIERIAPVQENKAKPVYKLYDCSKLDAAANKSSAQESSQNSGAEAAEAQDDLVTKELIGKDVYGICDILDKLQLGDYRGAFIDQQIDGELLNDIPEGELVSDINMTLFEAKKLCLYMRGWKPDDERTDYNEFTNERGDVSLQESDKAKSNDGVDTWFVSDVSRRMRSIKLDSFADFCEGNQVNGSLLAKMLDNDVLESVRKDHHVSLLKIEQRKLFNYVRTGWRPKSTS